MIDAATMRSQRSLLVRLLAALGFIGLVAYVLSRGIVRTLRELVRAAHAIAQGRLEERVPVRGRDEFAELGLAFNDMAAQLQARAAELEDERRRLREATLRMGETLAATHDPDQLQKVIVEAAVETTGASGATLVLEGGEPIRLGDPRDEDDRIELPLTAGASSFGTLILHGKAFDGETRETAVALAGQAVVALENARLHRIVERQALVDGLTGLDNRRHVEEELQAEIARAERFDGPLALVLADLDNFKSLNDATAIRSATPSCASSPRRCASACARSTTRAAGAARSSRSSCRAPTSRARRTSPSASARRSRRGSCSPRRGSACRSRRASASRRSRRPATTSGS